MEEDEDHDETVNLTARMPRSLREGFSERARKHGLPSKVLREILAAFVESRLVIKGPPYCKKVKFKGLFTK